MSEDAAYWKRRLESECAMHATTANGRITAIRERDAARKLGRELYATLARLTYDATVQRHKPAPVHELLVRSAGELKI